MCNISITVKHEKPSQPYCTVSPTKENHKIHGNNCQILTTGNFQNSSTSRHISQFVVKWLLKITIITSHLKCVATLPCEIFLFKNYWVQVLRFFGWEIGEIVRYLPDKKIRFPVKLSLLRGLHPKSAKASPNIWLTLFQISSKSVHFRQSYS